MAEPNDQATRLAMDAVLELEKLALADRSPIHLLQGYRWQQLLSSPLLLRIKGEQLMDDGAMHEAQQVLELALKGLASGVWQEQMLEAMALLSMLLRRTGQIGDAVALLTFLHAEHSRSAEAIPLIAWALGQGSHLIGQEHEADHYYEQAASGYTNSGNWRRAAEVYGEWLLKRYFSMDRSQWQVHLHRLEHICTLHQEAAPLLALLRAYDELAAGRTKPGERLLAECPDTRHLPSIWRTWHRELRRLLSALGGSHPDPSLPHVMPEDLEEQYLIIHTARFGCLLREEADEAAALDARLQALTRLGIDPVYPMLTSRLASLSADLGSSQMDPGHTGTWRISWFGGLAFASPKGELRLLPWRRRKSLELFLLLLTRPRYAIAREWAIELLFGDFPPKNAANQLYVTIHQLKRVLSEKLGVAEAVLLNGGTIQLREDWIESLDIEQFTTLSRVADQLWLHDKQLASEMYARAADIYGPVLPELQDIEWLDRYRAMLAERQSAMLNRLCHCCAEAEDWDSMLHYARCWIEADPLREEAYQRLIQGLARLGRTAEARDWYHRWEEICKRELDAEPLMETRNLLPR